MKEQIAPSKTVTEGNGALHFDMKKLYFVLLAIPLAASRLVGWGWFPLIFVLAALPLFAIFHIVQSTLHTNNTQRNKIDKYLHLKTNSLKKYKKIPIATFFESYFDGDIDIKGDMLTILEDRYDWATFTFTLQQAVFFVSQWVPETLWHSRCQDETQVREHYDRGDDFYNWFLGPMMIYTSGIMGSSTKRETLEQMQLRKLDTVLKKINLKAGDRMLDIGCGWGTLAIHAAKSGAKATGVTLGRNQTKWAEGKALEANVKDQVNILCMDYRDIPTQKFDKITCLEMAEHVGVLRFTTFLQQVRSMLEDDGLFFLQIAGLRRAWQYEDLQWGLFMAKYVFPGADASMPLNWVVEQLERNGFEVESIETLGIHYSTTIFRWYENWMTNRSKVVEKYGQRWFRTWEFFLAYSTIIARQGSATVYQLVSHKNLNVFDRGQFVERRFEVVGKEVVGDLVA